MIEKVMDDNTVIAGYYKLVNLFVLNAPFLYPLKTSENLMVF